MVKFMSSKKAKKIDELFTVNLTLCSKCQIDGEDFFNFCGLLRKHELYKNLLNSTTHVTLYKVLAQRKVTTDAIGSSTSYATRWNQSFFRIALVFPFF